MVFLFFLICFYFAVVFVVNILYPVLSCSEFIVTIVEIHILIFDV